MMVDGWIARDANNELYMHGSKPIWVPETGTWETEDDSWLISLSESPFDGLFEHLKFTGAPEYVSFHILQRGAQEWPS